MLIDGNPMEKEAMVMFHQGDDAEGHRLLDAFARAFQEEYQSKDYCPCTSACKYHGNCKVCVAIHRAHTEHVPRCLQPMLDERFAPLLGLTEKDLPKE